MIKTYRSRFFISLVATIFLTPTVVCAESSAPRYTPISGLAGTLTSIGSDTMVYLMSYWVVEFKRLHPDVQSRILQAGSATAPPALIAGASSVGPMSRKMNDKEVQAFVQKYGYAPTEVRVAMDALAVYINKNNPIQGMTLPQVDAVFSSTRKCGYSEELIRWGQLGLEAEWKDRMLAPFSRNLLSGTYAFFAEHAMCKGKFKQGAEMQPTSRELVRLVAHNPGGIGYSGIGYLTNEVRAVPLAAKAGEEFVPATAENVYSGKYPLSRFLYIYVNKAPGQPLPALEREFLKMVLSERGQAWVRVNGFIPISARVMHEELAKLD